LMAADIGPAKTCDFTVVSEDWSRYLASDGTMIKVRIVVRRIVRSLELNPQGYPNFGIEAMNAVSVIVPDRLMGPPSKEIWDPKKDMGQELKFETLEEKWQEYHTADGFKVFVKPVLMKVFRYAKCNDYGEPVYSANIQSLINAEKLTQPSVAV